MEDVVRVSCPACGEESELGIDVTGGPVQDYVQDCPVCCRPWQVTVRLERDGPRVRVRLSHGDE